MVHYKTRELLSGVMFLIIFKIVLSFYASYGYQENHENCRQMCCQKISF